MTPSVTVIIPVGPGHAHYLPAALASVEAQTVTDWECVVVDDTGLNSPESQNVNLRSVQGDGQVLATTGSTGAGAARNVGLAAAFAPWIVFLDADDELLPRALEHLLNGVQQHPEASYIYGDWWNIREGKEEYYQAPEYDQKRFLHHNLHVVTALYPTKVLRDIGGFDEALGGYEDWELNLNLAMRGYCGQRIPFPVISYRVQAGQRREWSRQNEGSLIQTIQRERYGAYLSGARQPMGCCGQPSTGQRTAQGFTAQALTGGRTDMIRMEYTGTQEGFIPFSNPFGGSGATYRGGIGANRYADVDPVDVDFLLGTGAWRLVVTGDKSEKPRKNMEAVIVHSVEAQSEVDQAQADALVAAGDVELPKRKRVQAKDGE